MITINKSLLGHFIYEAVADTETAGIQNTHKTNLW